MAVELNFLDSESDLKQINESIDSYLSILDHLQGKNFQPHPAPELMNRVLVNALHHRIKYLLVKRLAIEHADQAKKKTELASIVLSRIEFELESLNICDKFRTKHGTIRKWIFTDVSETYPAPKKDAKSERNLSQNCDESTDS